MGAIMFFIIVGVVVFMVFIFKNNHEYDEVRRNIAVNMYGGVPMVTSTIEENPKPELSATLELLRQATLMKDAETIKAINDGTYDGKLPERRSDGGWLSVYDDLRIMGIAGINHRQRIGSYLGRVDVALVPEPTNEFDPCAIKVVAEDGHHLGYIHRDQTDMVRSWVHNHFPHYCVAMVLEHDDEDDGHRFYTGYIYFIKTKFQNEKVSNVGDGGGLDTHRM
jgi:hypothetical protein